MILGFLVDDSIFEKRLKICDDCEEYIKDRKRCNKCGCFMTYKAKLKRVSCPLNKWGEEKGNEDGQS